MIHLTERGTSNLAVLSMVLSAVNLTLTAWLLMVYLPARAEADVRMARILQITHDEWERQHVRIVPKKVK